MFILHKGILTHKNHILFYEPKAIFSETANFCKTIVKIGTHIENSIKELNKYKKICIFI